jgi:hypothetical protein
MVTLGRFVFRYVGIPKGFPRPVGAVVNLIVVPPLPSKTVTKGIITLLGWTVTWPNNRLYGELARFPCRRVTWRFYVN